MARVEITETVSQALSALPVDGHSIPLTGLLLAPGDGASVEVRTRGAADTSGITLYVAETGGSTRANPLTAGVEGRIEAWVDPGSYDLHVSLNGETYTHYFEAVRGDDPGGGGMADSVVVTPATSARNVIQPSSAAAIPLTLKGAAAQTANLHEYQDSAGTVLGFVDAGGRHLVRADPGAVPYATLALMNNTPDDPPAAKRPALNFVHKAADGTETADWQWGEDVASDPPDLALFHPASGMDFLYITNEDNPRMGVATGTWDAPPEGSLSVVSRVTNRPALTFVTNDEDHEGWMARWGWGTGVWRGGIDSQTGGIAVGWGSSAPLALLHLDEGTTAAKGIRFGSDAVPLVMFRSAANKLTLQGQMELLRDTGAFANALVLRNADMTAINHGVGIRFDLGRITATEEAGYIRMLAEQEWTATTSTHDSAMTFATALDTVLTERLRLTSSGKVGINNAAPQAMLHVGAGLDTPATADVLALITAAGSAALAVRDSTNDAEAFLHASSAGIQFGSRTAHVLSFKTSDVERMQILSDGALQLPEMTTPSAAGANKGRLFMRDNGSGKTQFCAIFPTGAVQVIATEP